MPKNFPLHYLLTWGGSIVNGSSEIEEWSNTLRGVFLHLPLDNGAWDVSTRTEDEVNQFLIQTAVPALTNFIQDTRSHISGAARMEWVKCNQIAPDGKYVNDYTNGVFDLEVQGTGGTLRYPLQVSLAVTLETDKARGNANRGRIFLPTPSLELASSGLVQFAEAAEVALSVADLFVALADFDTDERTRFVPSVVSAGGKKDPVGARETITSVSVDTRLDIQRSRGAQQIPARYESQRLEYSDLF
jgi:hypothetical protein